VFVQAAIQFHDKSPDKVRLCIWVTLCQQVLCKSAEQD
jgi:hypothetical protein